MDGCERNICTSTEIEHPTAMNETYYGGFYGFDSAPFHITPDAAMLFPTQTHRDALGAIEYGIKAGKGFIVVSGQVGVGKTTVLRACIDALDQSKFKIIYLFNSALDTTELYSTILEELDPGAPTSANPAETLRALSRSLLASHQSGVQVVLAVDEAQNMPEQTLESLRILSNLETTQSKLLQIILVGQPELDAKLAKHSLRQLRQRVAVRARIKRLTFRQSCRYIDHRTRWAGRRTSPPLFTAPAKWYIALASGGIPRTINVCCDNTLINGYGHSAKRMTLAIAHESCGSLEYRSPARGAVILGVMLVAIVFGLVFKDAWLPHPAATPAALAPVPAAKREATPAPQPPIAPKAAAPEPQAAPEPLAPAQTPEAAASTPPSAVAPESPAAYDALADASLAHPDNRKQSASRQWVVRRGDTISQVCEAVYGHCDDQTVRKILARNPQIAQNAIIYPGQILKLPTIAASTD